MTNNCLVTKLKRSINNDSLDFLGSLKVKLTGGNHVKMNLQCSSDVRVWTTDGEFSYTFTPGNNAWPTYTPSSDTYLIISNKYAITKYQPSGQNQSNWRELDGTLDDFAYTDGLIILNTRLKGGDLSDLPSSVLDNLRDLVLDKSLDENAEYVTGEVGLLQNNSYLTNLQGALDYTNISGDLSLAPPKCNYVYIAPANMRGRKWTWKHTRDSSCPIMSIVTDVAFNFGDDLDACLINLAQCSTTGTYTTKSLILSGTRTSASDSAVTTLKSNGYMVKVNGVTL